MSSLWGALKGAGSWVGDEWHRHWKTIAAVAAGTVVAMAATAVILASAGTATPAVVMLAAGASGTLGGGTTQAVEDLLNHHRPGLDVVESAAVGGVVSVATLGAGRAVAPMVPETLARFLPGSTLPEIVDEAGNKSAAAVVKEAVSRNIPWGAIPKVILDQPSQVIAGRVSLGLAGALSALTHHDQPAAARPTAEPSRAPPAPDAGPVCEPPPPPACLPGVGGPLGD